MNKFNTIFFLRDKLDMEKTKKFLLQFYAEKGVHNRKHKLYYAAFAFYNNETDMIAIEDFQHITNYNYEDIMILFKQLRDIGVIKFNTESSDTVQLMYWKRKKANIIPRNFIKFCEEKGLCMNDFYTQMKKNEEKEDSLFRRFLSMFAK